MNSARSDERVIVYLLCAVQFINIVDFMMVMPLGPDFARALGIPLSHLGYIGGSYTLAAAASGLAGAFFLDRFDRKKALLVALVGLVTGTLAGGFAGSFTTLMVARVVAGAFGGPATSLAYSILADVVPVERRGRAMAVLMTSFSLAAVLGVPAGLELAHWGTWRMPFLVVAGVGFGVALGVLAWMPSLPVHFGAAEVKTPGASTLRVLARRGVAYSLCLTSVTQMSSFLLIPNLASYFLVNRHYPRNGLSFLYLAGGLVTIVTMRLIGKLVDHFGSARVGLAICALLAGVIYFGFAQEAFRLPVLLVFVGFMIANSGRNVTQNTLTSKVPGPAERARFGSLQSAVDHISTSGGAFLASILLHEAPAGELLGVPTIALGSLVLTGIAMPLFWAVERDVRQRALRVT